VSGNLSMAGASQRGWPRQGYGQSVPPAAQPPNSFAIDAFGSSFGGGSGAHLAWPPCQPRSPLPKVCVSLERSPTPVRSRSPRLRVRGGAASGSSSGANAAVGSRPESQEATPEDLKRGLASELALKFAGNLDFHIGNIAAVADAYRLEHEDICYCFLCLEEAASTSASSKAEAPGLRLGRWGTGQFAARVWTVALARFVKAAQKQRGALDDKRVQPLCDEWQYQSDNFLMEVKSCEASFQRQHGHALMQAFKKEGLRQKEVLRACHVLAAHSASSAPRPSRVMQALSDSMPGTAPQPSLKGLPSSAEARLAQREAALPALQDGGAMVAKRGREDAVATATSAAWGVRRRRR